MIEINRNTAERLRDLLDVITVHRAELGDLEDLPVTVAEVIDEIRTSDLLELDEALR